jgi:zinc/manganese transport system substrate-binding protein
MPLRALLLALALCILCAHLHGADEPAPHRLRVVAATTVIADLVRRIGGDHVDCHCLVAPGVDPHTFQPAPDDRKTLAEAELVVINGLGFEGWFDALLKESASSAPVAVASSGVAALTMSDDDHRGSTIPDPHAFNDPNNGVIYAENIRDALAKADPRDADDYRAWADHVIASLRLLDGWIKRQVAQLPASRRILVTDHDAMQYFAKAYGFTVVAPGSAIEDAQPGAGRCAAIVALIRAQNVHGVFFEAGKNPKVLSQIAAETGAVIGDDLYLDGVGPPGTLANSYEGMFLANVRAIIRTLQ